MRCTLALLAVVCGISVSIAPAAAAPDAGGTKGYYLYPSIHGNTIVFTAEGDLWAVGTSGGLARKLTSHPGEETHAAISPDGRSVAFSATYEGPQDAYLMPIEGGLPKRLTCGEGASVVGWTPDGRVLYATSAHSTLPDVQLCTCDPATQRHAPVPLRQASDGCYDRAGGTLYFTRQSFQGSHTKRYRGGTAQNIWRYAPGAKEAEPLTTSYTGTSKNPMWWSGRVYFVSDRDGTMNLWSMRPDGGDLRQLTRHVGFDIQSPAIDDGRIVYQLGADIWMYDIPTGQDRVVDIRLASDLDQTRERWVTNPMAYLTDGHISPDGDRVVLTARGQVFVAPVREGRFVEASRKPGVRYRHAQFAPDGKSLLVLSDETGETEWYRLPANGVGAATRLSSGASVLTTDGAASPDGKQIAYTDKNQALWLFDVEKKTTKKVLACLDGDVGDLRWSPDSRWLAFTMPTVTFGRVMLYSMADGSLRPVTGERYESYSPAWSADGKWLYFLSDRTFRTLVPAPWGQREPEPFFDRETKIYQLALTRGQRSPFDPADELHPASSDKPAKPPAAGSTPPEVRIDLDGLADRLREVPVPAGNYGSLQAAGNRLFWISRETGTPRRSNLTMLEVTNVDPAAKTLVDDVRGFEVSLDSKKLMAQKGQSIYVIDTSASAPASLDKKQVDLSAWSFPLQPREEWRQMFVEAWRLMRDYFYDPNMNGVDWPAVRDRYRPLVERVTDRAELSDLIGQMVGELSALHIFVVGGDVRSGTEHVSPASLGAVLERDSSAGGLVVRRIFQGDPDYPDELAPLTRPGVDVREGDVITAINGVPVLSEAEPEDLLRGQAGREVLLHVRSGSAERDVIVKPISPAEARNLRYTDWELSRRRLVEDWGKGQIGYVHLRAMGSGDIDQWERDFYPVFDRQGLIIDVRHNGGGNIDSWVLSKLLRKAWFYWQPRVGRPSWNMQWAFRGYLTVICDEWTSSDGEAFTEGFKRLGLGKVIGTRTWGGEIWLSFDNGLVDNGIASAAETGVYGPEGSWLIEGHGVDPDIVVDDLPHASYEGEDAQLRAAVDYLQKRIREKPIALPPAPRYPDKSFPPRPKRAPVAPPGPAPQPAGTGSS